MHLSQVEREMAVQVLAQLPTIALKKVIPVAMLKLVNDVEGRGARRSARELAEFLIDLYGVDLLTQVRIRHQLCLAMHKNALTLLAEAAGFPPARGSRTSIARQVAERRWFAGRWWARQFAATVGLPPVFAGSPPRRDAPDFEDVEVYERPKELYDYQKNLKRQVLSLFRAPSDRNRAILTLPTGAGKTRTVVEAVVEALAHNMLRRPRVLWVAQSDELCEQALGTFRPIWQARGKVGEALRLHRLWGGRNLPDLGETAIIVASIQKLHRMATDEDEFGRDLAYLGAELGAVIIDEAHHAIAPSYTEVLRVLGLQLDRRQGSNVPVLGLSATPYRNDSETQRLVRRFHSNLLVPWSQEPRPIERLQREGILSIVNHEVVPTGQVYEMTDKEKKSYQIFAELPDSFVRKIGADGVRNRIIVERIMEMDPTWPVLFFGCSKEHACAMAVLLRRKGVRAAVVTAETSRAARRAIVEDFRAGRVQVLCNYGIFTTGFDAPGVRAVVVSRPTASVVLYEQMVGRGMRGPRNGGTDECLIVDFGDNLERFGVPMAHTRFADYWRSRRSSVMARHGSEEIS